MQLLIFVQGVILKPFVKRFGKFSAIKTGFVALILSGIGFSLTENTFQVYSLCVVQSLGGMILPSLQSTMSGIVSDHKYGELQGAVAKMSGIAAVLGPIMFSQMFYFFSDPNGYYFPGAPFVASSLVSLVALFVVMTKIPKLNVAMNMSDM